MRDLGTDLPSGHRYCQGRDQCDDPAVLSRWFVGIRACSGASFCCDQPGSHGTELPAHEGGAKLRAPVTFGRAPHEVTLIRFIASRACSVQADCIVELVEEGLIAPIGREPHRWRFSGVHMRRATVAALAVQLLEEVEALRARLKMLGCE